MNNQNDRTGISFDCIDFDYLVDRRDFMGGQCDDQIVKNNEVVRVDEVANLIAQLPLEVKAALIMGCFGRANRLVQHLVGQQGKKARTAKNRRAGRNVKRK